MASLFQKMCLNSSNSLRTQLLLSFGVSAAVSLAIVVISACTSAYLAGQTVERSAENLMTQQVTTNLLKSSKLIADEFTARMCDMEGTVQIIAEALQDRIVGYPDAGWRDDRNVPFFDMDSQRNVYPYNATPPPMDWDIERNVNEANAFEHAQEREAWVPYAPVSSASGSWFIQGACDPAVDSTTSLSYYPNCTAANNDFATGGVVQPTAEAEFLHEKAGDLTLFLKPLFESQSNAILLGIYFLNDGAGATLLYPGLVRDGSSEPYVSIGCDWLREINPNTGRPFANEAAIARCHPAGSLVPQREYNPMERDFCRHYARQPDRIMWHGPFRANGNGVPIMTIGRSVFDRLTGEFIACVGVDMALSDLSKDLNTDSLNENAELALVRFDDGIVVGDSLNSIAQTGDVSLHVTETGIISNTTLVSFQQAVNFSQPWTAEEVDQAYQSLALPCVFGLITAYPLPTPPNTYDPNYKPQFLVIHAIGYDVFNVVNDIQEAINQDVGEIYMLTVGLGVFGIIVVMAIVWCVARMLTQPLLFMESVAWRIVNHADKRSGDALHVTGEDEMAATIRCTPKTEINELVTEFRKMIQGFSGTGASKVADSALHEIRNELTWHSDFQQLYSRNDKRSSFRCTGAMNGSVTSELTDEESSGPSSDARGLLTRPLTAPLKPLDEHSAMIVPAPVKRNRSRLISSPAGAKVGWDEVMELDMVQPHRSSLFWWIVVLIVIPLLLTNAVICAIVSQDIVTIIPYWVTAAEESSYQLELEALRMTASWKASLMSALVYESVRDLHLMTRMAGWTLFGAVKRSGSFVDIDSATEECKAYAPNECPYYSSDRVPCACEWHDLHEAICTSYNETYARYLQKGFFAVQRQDIDPVTGGMSNATSFPAIGGSPETTLWQSLANISLIPGYDEGAAAAGYRTTYDRIRVGSALAAVDYPIYNYATSSGRQKTSLGLYRSFDIDGLFMGWSGCGYTYASYSHWNSTESNRAYLIEPGLCPYGKYGYDPRCRDWYAAAKGLFLSSGVPVHITSPYRFAVQDDVATSATSPIANPRTGEYVGQVLLDFYPFGLREALQKLTETLSILITPYADATGGDTVVGPNKSAGWESAAISDLLFLYDPPGTDLREDFERGVLRDMKNGSSGMADFVRTTANGETEHFNLAYAPVIERVLLPLSPDSFSRGVSVSHKLLYSVAIGKTASAMRQPFNEISDDIQSQLNRVRAIYILVTILVSVLFTALTCITSLFVTKPMITLLRAVQNINAGKIEGDFPPLQGGSREVHRVYNSFAKLYKVVRISNTAFFSGNLKWAYHFVNDALLLFRKVDDQKAVGIACNNLGNTLFAIHYDSKEDISIHGCDEAGITDIALRHYDEAVEIAQHAFDEATPSELKADFAQQLADRLFNRGLFLLLMDGSDYCPDDARDRAFSDIKRARDLDYDVKDFWLEEKLLLKYSAAYYSRLLRRINGLAEFYDDIGLQQVWDVKELIDDADQLLFAAWNEPTAPLFHEVNRVGRLQQLEGAAILLYTRMGNDVEAARLAMRMFAEDEYLLESPFVRAGEALLALMRDNETMAFSKKTLACARDDLRRMLKSCKNVTMEIGKCIVFTFELSERWEGDPVLEKVNAKCLELYDRYVAANDHMGVVAYSTKESLTVEMGTKVENEGRQRTLLDLATSSTTERANPAFPLAVQMVVDSQASLDNDSFVIVVMDGYAWDTEACSSIQMQLDRLNRERNTSIHLCIVGLDVEDDSAREQCKELSKVSKSSFYVDASLENIDTTFDAITATIAGRQVTNGFLKGITMERF